MKILVELETEDIAEIRSIIDGYLSDNEKTIQEFNKKNNKLHGFLDKVIEYHEAETVKINAILEKLTF